MAIGLLLAGCGTAHDKGPYLPQGSATPAYESTEPVVLLDPGIYDVSVSSPAFAPAEYQGLVLNVGSTVNLPVTLQVGTTTETAGSDTLAGYPQLCGARSGHRAGLAGKRRRGHLAHAPFRRYTSF